MFCILYCSHIAETILYRHKKWPLPPTCMLTATLWCGRWHHLSTASVLCHLTLPNCTVGLTSYIHPSVLELAMGDIYDPVPAAQAIA